MNAWYRAIVMAIAWQAATTLPALAFECPKPEAGGKGTLAELPAEIEQLSALLGSGDVENRVDEIASDLKRKHPQVDPTDLANFMVTAYRPVVAAGPGGNAEKDARLAAFSDGVWQTLGNQ